MENQHRKIKGYRELTQEEIDLMNKVKTIAAQVGELISEMEIDVTNFRVRTAVDQHWLAIAKTDLQKGFMSLTRSVAKPEFF